jgi:hypothetical protein
MTNFIVLKKLELKVYLLKTFKIRRNSYAGDNCRECSQPAVEVETRADDVNPDKKRDQNQNNIKDLSQKLNVQISTVNDPQKDSQKLNGPQMMYTFPRFRQSIIKRSNRNDCCEGSNDDKPRSQEVKCRSLGRPTRVRVAQTPSRSSFKRLLFPFRSKRRQIEADAKSLNSFSNHSGHSRKSSDTSQISLVSGKLRVFLIKYIITRIKHPKQSQVLPGRAVSSILSRVQGEYKQWWTRGWMLQIFGG